MGFILGALVGVGVGYGFRGWIRRHIGKIGTEVKADLQQAKERLEAALPGLEATVKADVAKAIAAIKNVL